MIKQLTLLSPPHLYIRVQVPMCVWFCNNRDLYPEMNNIAQESVCDILCDTMALELLAGQYKAQ